MFQFGLGFSDWFFWLCFLWGVLRWLFLRVKSMTAVWTGKVLSVLSLWIMHCLSYLTHDLMSQWPSAVKLRYHRPHIFCTESEFILSFLLMMHNHCVLAVALWYKGTSHKGKGVWNRKIIIIILRILASVERSQCSPFIHKAFWVEPQILRIHYIFAQLHTSKNNNNYSNSFLRRVWRFAAIIHLAW